MENQKEQSQQQEAEQTTEERIEELKQKQEQLNNLINFIVRSTMLDGDSLELLAASARLNLAEKKLVMVSYELKRLQKEVEAE